MSNHNQSNTSLPQRKRGRPLLFIIRRCISILPEDDLFLRTLGSGNLSNGIRQAAITMRGKKGEPR